MPRFPGIKPLNNGLVQFVKEIIISIDEEGIIKEIWSASNKFIGYPISNLPGKNITVYMDQLYARLFRKTLEYIPGSKKIVNEEILFITRSKNEWLAVVEIQHSFNDSGLKQIVLRVSEIPVKNSVHLKSLHKSNLKEKLVSAPVIDLKKQIHSGKINAGTKDQPGRYNLASISEHLLNHANIIIIMLDKKGKIEFFNDSAEKITGYKRNEVIGKNWFDLLISSGTLNRLSNDFNKLVQTGLSQNYENPIYTKAGELKYLSWQNNQVIINGKIMGTISFGIDITERKEAEMALNESEERYRVLADNPLLGVAWANKNYQIVYANETFSEMLGYTKKELANMTFKDITCEVDIDIEVDLLKKLLNKETDHYRIEKQYITKHKEIVWVELNLSVVYDSQNEIKYFVGIIANIQSRKIAQLELQRSEERFRILSELLPLPVILINRQGLMSFVNHSFTSVYGYTIDDIRNYGQRIKHFYPEPKYRKIVTAKFKEDIEILIHSRAGETRRHEIVITDKNKIPKTTELTFSIKDEMIFAVLNDVSEKKIAAELLNESKAKLTRIIDKLPVPLACYELSENRKMVFINAKFTDAFGYELNDIPTVDSWGEQAMLDVKQYLERKKEWREAVDNMVKKKTRTSPSFEFDVYCKDRTIKTQQLSFVIDEGLVYVTFTDITLRKQAEGALQESEQKFRNIASQLPLPIGMIDKKEQFLFLNNAFTKTFGYGIDEIKSFKDFMSKVSPVNGKKRSYDENWQNIRKGLQSGQMIFPPMVKYDFTCKNGSHKWIEFAASFDSSNLYVVFNDITDREQFEKELQESHRQLRELASRMEDIREEERKHIAREIHDELGQQLTGLKMDMSWLQKKSMDGHNPDVPIKIKSVLLLIDDTIKSVRKISTELRPSILDDLGLIPALEWQSYEFNKRTGIECVFLTSVENLNLSKSANTGIFRIYQEALTNIARHASAKGVKAILRCNKSILTFSIEDDGKGFDIELVKEKKTLGLVGIKERILMMQGYFVINSHINKGTKLTISIPLKSGNKLKERL